VTLGLFDLDNTLIDRRAMFARWASGMLERLGIGEADGLAWLIEVDGNGYGDKARWMPQAAKRFDVPEEGDRSRPDDPLGGVDSGRPKRRAGLGATE
jgi:hypothetical protein